MQKNQNFRLQVLLLLVHELVGERSSNHCRRQEKVPEGQLAPLQRSEGGG